MDKDKLEKNHNCDNVNCNHNNTKGLCCLFNPDNCKYIQLQKENAKLKAENQKWKAEWQGQVQKATDEGYVRTLQTIQLTKAKNLLQKVADVCGYPNYDIPVELYADIEHFISEVEK